MILRNDKLRKPLAAEKGSQWRLNQNTNKKISPKQE